MKLFPKDLSLEDSIGVRTRRAQNGQPAMLGCEEWIGTRNSEGYGMLRTNEAKKLGEALAHRIVFMFSVGPIPEGLLVLHSCDNPPCVNPGHLFLGTDADNVSDMRAKGRHFPPPHRKGIEHHSAVLSVEDVIGIRSIKFWSRGGKREMARGLEVHESTIQDILKRRTWRHIP
ncbi:MAG: HNH endonuclease [Acidobacteria bacterium]|nr:HNH endonuclease [Acidobacteriota bacterium]